VPTGRWNLCRTKAHTGDTDMDLLFGPLYHRYLNGHLPLDDSFARGVAHMVATAATAGAAASDPRRLS
jgi:hypothetical protein